MTDTAARQCHSCMRSEAADSSDSHAGIPQLVSVLPPYVSHPACGKYLLYIYAFVCLSSSVQKISFFPLSTSHIFIFHQPPPTKLTISMVFILSDHLLPVLILRQNFSVTFHRNPFRAISFLFPDIVSFSFLQLPGSGRPLIMVISLSLLSLPFFSAKSRRSSRRSFRISPKSLRRFQNRRQETKTRTKFYTRGGVPPSCGFCTIDLL